MVLSLASLCVAVFAFQLVAIHWVEPRHVGGFVNGRPIVGILTLEYHDPVTHLFNGSHVPSSYVKAAEAAGARVVPILIGKDASYYKYIVNSVNGVMFPGGDVNFWDKGGYGEAANLLYKLITEANRNGNRIPLYGTCLGFEMLAVASTDMDRDVLDNVTGTDDIPLPLKFVDGAFSSHLYGSTPENILRLLQTRNITANHHSECFTPSSWKKFNLAGTWRILTTSESPGGKTFVSSMEHVQHPQIFGTQFHPEKIPYEWTRKSSDPHNYEAILANRWFYDYFVGWARRNLNKFPSEEEEKASLIYNISPEYLDGYFEQIYRFDSAAPIPSGRRIIVE